MNHIKDQTALLAACQSEAGTARLFNLSQRELETSFEANVIGQITAVPGISMMDHASFTAYARGYLASLTSSIRQIECEFVYRTTAGVTFGTKVGTSSRPFYGDMTAPERASATTGYVWRGTSVAFSAFTRTGSVKEVA